MARLGAAERALYLVPLSSVLGECSRGEKTHCLWLHRELWPDQGLARLGSRARAS